MAETDHSGQVLAVKTLAMPADTNPSGDIFGGWLMAQMDIAGGVVAYERAQGRTVTIAVDGMTFLKPVYVGDLVTCYARIIREGRTSLSILIEAFARRGRTSEEVKVTAGTFTYVALGEDRKPRPLPAPAPNAG
ncbi:MAG: acyl-CoA thioesterase [Pseudomonadota bacterium]